MTGVIDGVELNIPEHVAIIMDGNGRWAKKRLKPRTFGHAEGAKVLEQTCEDCYNLGIKCLTVYAFSTENWKRSVEEVSTIMNIFRKYLVDSIERANKNNMRVRVIGRRDRLDEDILEKIDNLEKATAANDGLQFTVAINYGGRDEIIRAAAKYAEDVKNGAALNDNLDEETFTSYLDTAELPDPDLLIRTSGEIRTSNFLPWQIAYSEFYFTDIMWPEFNMEELKKAVFYFNKRERRFGGAE